MSNTLENNFSKAMKRAAYIFSRVDKRYFGWIGSGIWYGYPSCCIIWFCNERLDFRQSLDDSQNRVNQNLGFIPCPKCAKKVDSGKIKLESLIKTRICPHKFPKDE